MLKVSNKKDKNKNENKVVKSALVTHIESRERLEV